jgi:hypothetical protein
MTFEPGGLVCTINAPLTSQTGETDNHQNQTIRGAA